MTAASSAEPAAHGASNGSSSSVSVSRLLDLPRHLQEEILLRSGVGVFRAEACCRGLRDAACAALASPTGVAHLLLYAVGDEALVAMYSSRSLLRSLLGYIPGASADEGAAALAVLEELEWQLGGIYSASRPPSECLAFVFGCAAAAGHAPVLKYLASVVRSEPEVYDPDASNGVLLRWAAQAGHENAVVQLLVAGADPRAADGAAFAVAAVHGHWGIARRLLAAGAPADAWGGEALSAAVAQGRHECASELLVDHGAEASLRTLLLAAQHGRTGLLRRLAMELPLPDWRAYLALGKAAGVAAMCGQAETLDEIYSTAESLGLDVPAVALLPTSLLGALMADQRELLLRQAGSVHGMLLRTPTRTAGGVYHCLISAFILLRALPVALLRRRWYAVRPLLGACQRGALAAAAAGAAWMGWRRPGGLAALGGAVAAVAGWSCWDGRHAGSMAVEYR
ncbi:hypothetical protein GPECTOR_83g289 [Gonium pectorale]|uniref:Uncharacterized protein n=1 Tax=Gonium pectorale TaxID=33097 RepID=A0A150G1G1_GONPE|nr:hypothetical protein GPECTOR_83g289 [Gonium pectorale]|eukprot:KXZ43677.1 hypothetical protein GPECTOR_83g289 [Gonium pectorale]